MEIGKKVFVARECIFGTLYVYGEGTYIGDLNLINEETGHIVPGPPKPCVELESGHYFFEGVMQGKIGSKEEIYSSYEGLYSKIREVNPDGFSIRLKPVLKEDKEAEQRKVEEIKNKNHTKMEAIKTKHRSKQPMVIFAKSKDGRVTIAGAVTHIDEETKKCKIAIGFAKQRKSADPVNRRKLARQIAKGRALKNPFVVATIDYGAPMKAVQLKIEDVQSAPSQASVIVEIFRSTFTSMADEFASAPLPSYVCAHYKLKTIEDDKTFNDKALA